MNARFPLMTAAVAALLTSALLVPTGAGADRPKRQATATDRNAVADYVRARAADDLGELDVAAQGYAAALRENPGDTKLTLRAFRQAVAAGDMPLALQSARALDAAQSLPPDGTLLLLTGAVQGKDWKQALALADRIDREKLFAFLTPSIRAWVAFGSHKGDPLAILSAVPSGGLAAGYAGEHHALLLLATGKYKEGVAALNSLDLTDGGRGARLRIAAASLLAQHRKADMAAAILVGTAPSIDRAKAELAAGRKLIGAIDTAPKGVAELFARVAADINKQQAAPLALGFARMAAQLAPDDSEAWLLASGLLGLGGASEAGLAALDHIAPNDPFIGAARDQRLTLLVRLGRSDEALQRALATVQGPDATAADWARLGDLYSTAKKPADAAPAYAKALELSGGERAEPDVAWPLLLQQASALLDAGHYPEAREKAARAMALAPQQPVVLNFLGYSELEHGEDVPAAAALIAKASALAPDDPSITDSLGWSWYLRGNLDRAIPLLERAARGAPAESDINEHLGDAYWKAGRKLDARYAWRAALVAAEADEATRLKGKIDNGLSGGPSGGPTAKP
jgi:tetratricopeptide (TPR) repeat protein